MAILPCCGGRGRGCDGGAANAPKEVSAGNTWVTVCAGVVESAGGSGAGLNAQISEGSNPGLALDAEMVLALLSAFAISVLVFLALLKAWKTAFGQQAR